MNVVFLGVFLRMLSLILDGRVSGNRHVLWMWHVLQTFRGRSYSYPGRATTFLYIMYPCFVVFPSFTDAFPAVFLAITFVCLSFPSQNRDFNFPAALGETAGKASEEFY